MNTDVIANDFLEHYGVLGMKWGVRKKPEKNSNGWKETKQDKPYSLKDSCKNSNPYYDSGFGLEYDKDGYVSFSSILCQPYKINCAKCSVAYDLRRKGYNVQAKPVYINDLLKSDSRGVWISPEYKVGLYKNRTTGEKPKIHYSDGFSSYSKDPYDEFKDISLMSESDRAEIVKKISDEMIANREGARGVFDFKYGQDGGGHSVNWEVIDGKVMIIDSQSNETFTLDEFMETVGTFCWYRTDDCDIVGNIDEYVEPYGLEPDEERTKRKIPNRRRSIKLEEMGEEGYAD